MNDCEEYIIARERFEKSDAYTNFIKSKKEFDESIERLELLELEKKARKEVMSNKKSFKMGKISVNYHVGILHRKADWTSITTTGGKFGNKDVNNDE